MDFEGEKLIGKDRNAHTCVKKWYSPFFRFESGRRVSWNEEERTHRVHVTKRWKKHTHRSVRIQEAEPKQTYRYEQKNGTHVALLQPFQ